MTRKNRIQVDKLQRLMVYLLGHRPDEFGLVPATNGFVPFKELLWAIHEEPGWGYVRQGHINEVLMGRERTLFQSEGDSVRLLHRQWRLDLETPALSLPKLLYTPIRRRAHAHVMENGLRSERPLVLTPDRDMALRIGRRKDPRPVLVEVLTSRAREEGISIHAFGDLFVTLEIPPGCLVGPPVDLKALEAKERKRAEKEALREPPAFSPGTFTLTPDRDPDPSRRARRKGARGWKEDARKMRRRKAR